MMRPDPIIMTRAAHLDHIMGHGRLRQIDADRDDVIFVDEEKVIVRSIMEHELWPSEPPVMHWPKREAWIIAAMLWVPIIVLVVSVFRP